MQINKLINIAALVSLFAGLIYLTFNKHSRTENFTYHSQIWSDKAGYYIYLPAAFIYNFDVSALPDSIVAKTGNGFKLENNKVYTKYTYGVALLQFPFFLTAHVLAKPLGFDNNGFSTIYRWSIDVAAVFYLFISLIILYRLLKNYFNKIVTLTSLAIILLGTNLYYYAIDETGMSHIYSFFVFCLYIYSVDKILSAKDNPRVWNIILLAVSASLIVLIRPINILILPLYFLWNATGSEEVIFRIKLLLKPSFALISILSAFIVFLPQLFYWKYISGSYFSYSYGNEAFTNWNNPKLLEVWFSPQNGLFTNNPLYVLIFTAILVSIFYRQKNSIFVLTAFMIVSYYTASWWLWSFGCAFGSRNFVEYASLFSFPLAFFIKKMNSDWSKLTKTALYLSIFICVLYNMKLIYSYDGCWYGHGEWDWNAFLHLLTSKT